MKNVKLLDTVAVIDAITKERLMLVEPEYCIIDGLPSGQVGTILEVYEREGDRQFLIEFADNQGREYAMAILRENEFLVLHDELQLA